MKLLSHYTEKSTGLSSSKVPQEDYSCKWKRIKQLFKVQLELASDSTKAAVTARCPGLLKPSLIHSFTRHTGLQGLANHLWETTGPV